jgi:hypothetical protein
MMRMNPAFTEECDDPAPAAAIARREYNVELRELVKCPAADRSHMASSHALEESFLGAPFVLCAVSAKPSMVAVGQRAFVLL